MAIIGFIILISILFVVISAVAVLVLIFISGIISNIHGVPYIPIKRKIVKSLLAWGGLASGDILYDLGCGDARALISGARYFGAKKAVGYEIAPWSYLEAKFAIRLAGLHRRVNILRKNFFQADLSGATFVYIYLFHEPVDRLASKLARELKPSAKILCPSFPINLMRHPEFKLLKSKKVGKISAYLYAKI